TINDGGTLAPGSSPGTLEITGNLTLADEALFIFELGADQASSDSVTVGGELLLNGHEWDDFTFILPGAFASQYVLFDAASISGALGANLSGTLGDGITGTISVVGDDV